MTTDKHREEVPKCTGGILNSKPKQVDMEQIKRDTPTLFDAMVQALCSQDECKHIVRPKEGEYRCERCNEEFKFC